MAAKYHPEPKVKALIREWSPELFPFIKNRTLNGDAIRLETDTIGGKKHTWSLSFEWDAFGSKTETRIARKGNGVEYQKIVHLPDTSVTPEEIAGSLLHELAHVKLSMALASPKIAARSSLYQGYKNVFESANQMDVEKGKIIRQLMVISKMAGTFEGDRVAKAGSLFRIFVEEKFVNDLEARATGNQLSDSKLAEKYARYLAGAAEGNKTGIEGRVSDQTGAALPDLQKAVFDLYDKISSIPQNKTPGYYPPPRPLLERVKARRGPRPQRRQETIPAEPPPAQPEKHGFVWKLFHPFATLEGVKVRRDAEARADRSRPRYYGHAIPNVPPPGFPHHRSPFPDPVPHQHTTFPNVPGPHHTTFPNPPVPSHHTFPNVPVPHHTTFPNTPGSHHTTFPNTPFPRHTTVPNIPKSPGSMIGRPGQPPGLPSRPTDHFMHRGAPRPLSLPGWSTAAQHSDPCHNMIMYHEINHPNGAIERRADITCLNPSHSHYMQETHKSLGFHTAIPSLASAFRPFGR